MFEDINKNIQIFSSRDKIRTELIDYAKKNYINLQGVDFEKSDFISYIVNVLSILSANQIYFSSISFREMFFLLAQTKEAVFNLAAWIGYDIPSAEAATCNILITLPLSFSDNDVTVIFPKEFKISSGNIEYTINTKFTLNTDLTEVAAEALDMNNSSVTTRILNNKVVTVYDSNGFNYPVELNTSGSTTTSSFLLPFIQQKKTINTFIVPDDLEFYQTLNKKLTSLGGNVNNIDVYVLPPGDTTDEGTILNTIRDNIKNAQTVQDFEDSFIINTEVVKDKSLYKWTRSTTGVYTFSSTDKKYIWSSIGNEGELIFGNGIVGQQPERNSLIIIILSITNGEDGKVVEGKLTSSDNVFYQEDSGKVKKVKITTINPYPSTGGKNSPSLSEIKKDAITNIVAKDRLVSSDDFDNITTILKNLPLKDAIPILKRSDLKVNEINFFTRLLYNHPVNGNEIVPTRNVKLTTEDTDLYILKGYSPTGDNSEFETIFSMKIDSATSSVKYEYNVEDIYSSTTIESIVEILNQRFFIFTPTINIKSTFPTNSFSSFDIAIKADTNHIASEDFRKANTYLKDQSEIPENWTDYVEEYKAYLSIVDVTTDDILMSTVLTPTTGEVANFSTTYTIDKDFPYNDVKFSLRIETKIPEDIRNLWGIVSTDDWFALSIYSFNATIKRDLSEFLYSTVIKSGSTYTIYDVPTVLSKYFDDVSKSDFEIKTIQALINNINISSKRMMTDFINIKFPDTHGKLINMKYNTEKYRIQSKSSTSFPEAVSGDYYIVTGKEGSDNLNGDWINHINKLAFYNGIKWSMIQPEIGDIALVENVSDSDYGKKFAYTGNSWIIPEFEIPFKIRLRITKDPTVATTNTALINNIKTELVNKLTPIMGMDKNIDVSYINHVVRGLEGVLYSIVEEPQISLKFNYKINELTSTELLEYSPQLVAFTEDTITVEVS